MNTGTDARHQGMVRMRRIALLLLLLMAALFGATIQLEGRVPEWLAAALPWIRAFSEAAMVGACADWFAVSALFRHPFGIPIPHTAIIPSNKERIGVTLGEFVQANFLTPSVIGPKVNSAKPATRIAEWLSAPVQREKVAVFMSEAIAQAVTSMNDGAIRTLFSDVSRDTIRRVDAGDLASRVLDLLIADGKHAELLGNVLTLIEQAVEKHQAFIRSKVRAGMPWWVPGFVRDKVYDQILGRFKETLHEINADSNHVIRGKIDESLRELVEKLKVPGPAREEAERFKSWLLTRPVAAEFTAKLFEDLKLRLLSDLSAEDSRTRAAISDLLGSVAEHLAKDEGARNKIDGLIEQAAVWGAARHGAQLTELIADTVRGWDTHILVSKIESEVGRDLQFIRINGTIVGGIIGLLLHAVTLLIAR